MTESLGRFGKRFADEVVDAAFDLADAVHRKAEPAAVNSDPSPEVIRECLLFHTYIAGHFGCLRYGLAGRVLFVGALIEEVAESGLATDFIPAIREAQHTHGQCRQLVAEPGQATGGTALALISERLAQLYDAKGDRPRAAAYYQNFIDLWKSADPELQPRVAAARARLARLSDPEKAR